MEHFYASDAGFDCGASAAITTAGGGNNDNWSSSTSGGNNDDMEDYCAIGGMVCNDDSKWTFTIVNQVQYKHIFVELFFLIIALHFVRDPLFCDANIVICLTQGKGHNKPSGDITFNCFCLL